MGLPGIFAEKHSNLGMLKVAVRPATEHVFAYPELACFFLGKGVRSISDTQCGQGALGVHAGQVIALAASSVIEDTFATMGIAYSA